MVLSLVVALLLCLAGSPGHGLMALTPAGAQSAPPAAQIADQLDSSGRYLQFDATPAEDQAIASANERGVAFVWLDVDDDAEQLAKDVADELFSRPARYSTVLVLTTAGVGARSDTVGSGEINDAIDASFDSLSQGAVADGLDEFVASLAGQQTPRTSVAPSGSGTGSDSGGDGGGGGGSILLPVLGVLVVGGGGFLLLRSLSRRRKVRQLAAAEMEADRAEITEQLRDNADRVLQLGDRVIASKDNELITSYEQASAAYQEVSLAVDGATTAEQVDALDDKIDHAEWQLQSIEAKLDGRPAPPPPPTDDRCGCRPASTFRRAHPTGSRGAGTVAPIGQRRPGPGPRRLDLRRQPRRLSLRPHRPHAVAAGRRRPGWSRRRAGRRPRQHPGQHRARRAGPRGRRPGRPAHLPPQPTAAHIRFRRLARRRFPRGRAGGRRAAPRRFGRIRSIGRWFRWPQLRSALLRRLGRTPVLTPRARTGTSGPPSP